MVAGLVQPHEALDEREPRTQGVGVHGIDVSRQRDGLAGLDGLRGCEPGFIGDQVEGAEPVVFSPSAPVGQGCHVLLDIGFRDLASGACRCFACHYTCLFLSRTSVFYFWCLWPNHAMNGAGSAALERAVRT